MIAVLTGRVQSVRALSEHIAVAEVFHIDGNNSEGLRSERSTCSLPEKPDDVGPMQIKSEEIGT